MKKSSLLVLAAIVSGLFVFVNCTQGQKKEEVTEGKKDIYLQLYSVRDDIKDDYAGTIAKVA